MGSKSPQWIRTQSMVRHACSNVQPWRLPPNPVSSLHGGRHTPCSAQTLLVIDSHPCTLLRSLARLTWALSSASGTNIAHHVQQLSPEPALLSALQSTHPKLPPPGSPPRCSHRKQVPQPLGRTLPLSHHCHDTSALSHVTLSSRGADGSASFWGKELLSLKSLTKPTKLKS